VKLRDALTGGLLAILGLGVDFPLADFLSEAPSKAFLTGGTGSSIP
jgi:hypothetical protein